MDQIVILFIFFAFVLYGFYAKGEKESQRFRGFAFGERGRSWFPIAAGLSMTYTGGAATLNMASLGYQYEWWGLVDPLSVFLGLSLLIFFVEKYRKGNGITVADMLASSDARLSLFIGTVTALVSIVILSAQFVALGKLFTPIFPFVDERLLIFGPSLLVFSYVFAGGFASVNRTDVLQAIVLFFFLSLPILFVVCFVTPEMELPPIPFKTMPLDVVILLSLSLIFIPFAQDTNLRIKAAKDSKNARIGLLLGGTLYALFVVSSLLAGIYMAKSGVVLEDPETALSLFFTRHFSLMGVLFMGGVLAAVVSTLDSFSHSAIVTIANDILHPVSRKRIWEDSLTIRISAGIVLLSAMAISLFFKQILGLVLTGLLLYVSIVFPIALGRFLNVGSRQLLCSGLLVSLGIVVCEVFSLPVTPKALVYPGIHLAIVLILYAGKAGLRIWEKAGH